VHVAPATIRSIVSLRAGQQGTDARPNVRVGSQPGKNQAERYSSAVTSIADMEVSWRHFSEGPEAEVEAFTFGMLARQIANIFPTAKGATVLSP
jgi:hypothetical protein